MIFNVEDGTGLDDATSYCSVADSDNYLGSDWAVDEPTKEAALMAGTEYADSRWGCLLRSRPLTDTQSLEFPRLNIHDRYGNPIEGVPIHWCRAVMLYAQISLEEGALYPSNANGNNKEVKKKKTVVGPITTELEYQGIISSSSWLAFPLPDKYAKEFIGPTGGVYR